MPPFKTWSLLLLLPLALAACDSNQPSYSASNPPPAAAPAAQPPPAAPVQAPAAEPPPAAAPAAPAAQTAAPAARDRAAEPAKVATAQAVRLPPAEQVGIASCDAYVSRYRACLENDDSGLVAPVQRKYQLAHMLARQVRQWKVQAKDGKSGDIANACTQAGAQAKETLGKLGCRAI